MGVSLATTRSADDPRRKGSEDLGIHVCHIFLSCVFVMVTYIFGWVNRNYKPTDSDLEDEEDEDEDDDDPASWFHDDQDDGLKGQDIVYPDPEELAYTIRVDDSKFNHQLYGSEDVD